MRELFFESERKSAYEPAEERSRARNGMHCNIIEADNIHACKRIHATHIHIIYLSWPFWKLYLRSMNFYGAVYKWTRTAKRTAMSSSSSKRVIHSECSNFWRACIARLVARVDAVLPILLQALRFPQCTHRSPARCPIASSCFRACAWANCVVGDAY